MDKADMDENYTYIVRCADGTLYTGWTNDLIAVSYLPFLNVAISYSLLSA